MGGGFKNKNVTLSPRLKTITRTKIITFKTNHQSASPEFRGLGFPDLETLARQTDGLS